VEVEQFWVQRNKERTRRERGENKEGDVNSSSSSSCNTETQNNERTVGTISLRSGPVGVAQKNIMLARDFISEAHFKNLHPSRSFMEKKGTCNADGGLNEIFACHAGEAVV